MKVVDTLRSVMHFRKLELDPVARRLATAASVADLRRIAERRLPRGVFDYIDGGAEDERTLRDNSDAFARIEFRPRVLRSVAAIDTATTLLGKPLPFPLVLAPTGSRASPIPRASSLSLGRPPRRPPVHAVDAVDPLDRGGRRGQRRPEVVPGLRLARPRPRRGHDRALSRQRLRGARDDRRHGGPRSPRADVRRGFELPPKLGLGTLLDGAVHPGWTWAFARAEPIVFANVATGGRWRGPGDGSDAVTLATYVNAQFDPDLSWDDVDWFRSRWDRPLVVKGIQMRRRRRPRRGARRRRHRPVQPRRPPARLRAAPVELVGPVVDAVGDRTEVICDGGVRRGSDIVKAVALGARACMAGRAYLYGLGAAGERGVDHVLSMLHTDVRRTMALLGAPTIADLHADLVGPGARR